MADRKSRCFTFKVPPGTRLGDLKQAIEHENAENIITVFQEIGTDEYLVELTNQNQAQEIIENGFDTGSNHIRCHPPHGYYLNVSIMGLKAYISDEDVCEKLQQYGEIKGQVIRLKYRLDHELAGLENGNRLVRMVLHSPSIPYSLQIVGEWCRIIHNHQIRICSHCNEQGHSRKHCPTIECRKCGRLGHLSFHCPANSANHTETADATSITTENDNQMDHADDHDDPESMTEPTEPTEANDEDEQKMDEPGEIMHETTASNPPEDNRTDTKRPHHTDTDSDPAPLPRRFKKKPTPNVNAARPSKKHKK